MLSSRVVKSVRQPVLALLVASLVLVVTSQAQNDAKAPVEQLRQRLTSGSATAVVHLSNLHGSTQALVRPVDNLVVNGVVRERPVIGLLRGADEIIPAGQRVQITAVEGAPGKRNDTLRVTVSTPGNAVALIAFVLPAEALQGMTEPQLEKLVFPALTPIEVGSAATPASTQRSPARTPSPASWVLRKTATGSEALLHGSADAAGNTIPALLVIGCPTTAIAYDRPALTPMVELRVPKNSVSFDISFVGEKDGDDNGYVHFQVGTSPEIHADLATWTLVPDSGTVATLGLDLHAGELEQLLLASASSLRISVIPPDSPATALKAQFTLPSDSLPASAAIGACLQHAKAAEAAVRASHPVECPRYTDVVLISADIRRAATGKSLPVDPDRDQGVGWMLPRSTKSHPAATKVQLVCSYGQPDQKTPPSRITKVENFPVPSGATYCESWIETTESRSRAYCAK